MDGAPNDVSYKNDRPTPGISIYYFPKDVAVCQNGSVSIVVREEILLFKVAGPMLRCVRFDFEDGCHEHIPLVKSGELRLPVNSAEKNAD